MSKFKINQRRRLTKWQKLGIGLSLGGALYLGLLYLAPAITLLDTFNRVDTSAQPTSRNQIIIPEANIQTAILEGDESVLERGAQHRFPERGDPASGGNFIVSAHRYIFSPNPVQVRKQSYFYNLAEVNVGDQIFVDWKGKRHEYRVTKTFQVQPNEISIEAPSEDPKLTIYTCTLKGSADGRVVVVAEPVKTE